VGRGIDCNHEFRRLEDGNVNVTLSDCATTDYIKHGLTHESTVNAANIQLAHVEQEQQEH